MRKKAKGRTGKSKVNHLYWLDWVFLKRFHMFGDGKGWKEQSNSLINFLILCMNVEAGIQAEQAAKNKSNKKRGR